MMRLPVLLGSFAWIRVAFAGRQALGGISGVTEGYTAQSVAYLAHSKGYIEGIKDFPESRRL